MKAEGNILVDVYCTLYFKINNENLSTTEDTKEK